MIFGILNPTFLTCKKYFIKTNKCISSQYQSSPWKIFLKSINVALRLLGSLEQAQEVIFCVLRLVFQRDKVYWRSNVGLETTTPFLSTCIPQSHCFHEQEGIFPPFAISFRDQNSGSTKVKSLYLQAKTQNGIEGREMDTPQKMQWA